MVQRIAHLADIHIHKSIRRHEEYKQVFNELIVSLRKERPDRIVIVGDLFNDYIKLEGELLVLVTKFLNALTKVAPVVITRGNHDVLKAASNRMDSIQAVVESIANPNIKYLNTTGMVDDDNVVWCVWKHGEKKNNPWPKNFEKDQSKIYIDLFHDPVNGCVDANGYEFESRTYRSISEFKGDLSFFGDIHKHQYFEENTKAYVGSLIAQNYSEGDDEFHGYILWDIANKTHQSIRVANKHNYHTVVVNRFTDFDDLNIDIPNISQKPSIRVKWQTLPAQKNIDNERKLWKYLEEKFAPLSYKHKNEFVEENKIDVQEKTVFENITKRDVLHTIFTDYLRKIGHEDEIIEAVLKLDEIIESRMVIEQLTNIQWSIVKFWGRNFRNIKSIDIDWRDKDGLYQITGKNTAGKSSIIQLLSYIQHGKTIETDSRMKAGDSRFVNNRSNASSCEGGLVIECNGEYYGIKRATTIVRNKEGEITKAPTVVNYYLLTSPDDEFIDGDKGNNLNALAEENRNSTQKRINEIIGTYDNFLRITLTTADSLNAILTTDDSEFLDAILADAGLNIFDQRLQELKQYKKEIITTDRITCNLETEAEAIAILEKQIIDKNDVIQKRKGDLQLMVDKIQILQDRKTDQQKKYHQIDSEIAKLDVARVQSSISTYKQQIFNLVREENQLKSTIDSLKTSFDEARLTDLIKQKDNHKNDEFKLRTEINGYKLQIEQTISLQHKHNGEIELLKREGKGKRDEITSLQESKTCPTCGREKNQDTVDHIQLKIKSIETDMFTIAAKIKEKTVDTSFQQKITELKASISAIEEQITGKSIGFETITIEIGKLTNDKQEVEKRDRLLLEAASYPVKIENINLKIQGEEDKIKRFASLQDQINENKQFDGIISGIDNELYNQKSQHQSLSNLISQFETEIPYITNLILQKKELIKKFNQQQQNDRVMDIYMKCIHRDGVPTQILRNNLLPKINNTLSDFLQPVDFNVWLDENDLRLKMSYATHPTAVIECIGGSGKERTFSSISLKVALNEINNKSKPSLFLLDEVMGKLKDESVEEFLEFVKLIKTKVRKLIIIEQNHEIQPDYVISAITDSNKISTITLES